MTIGVVTILITEDNQCLWKGLSLSPRGGDLIEKKKESTGEGR